MSKRKGMSLDDKRDAMLQIFQTSRDVFVLKDIEKLSVKKGIIQQSVKDVLQSLVDDDLVIQEKIGISNYFWSFPSDASVKMGIELDKLTSELKAAKKRKADLTSAITAAKVGKEKTVGVLEKDREVQALKDGLAKCDEELAKYKENDPETFKAMIASAQIAKLSANRWTDNLDSLLSWSKKQFEGNEEDVITFFKENGAVDLDYI